MPATLTPTARDKKAPAPAKKTPAARSCRWVYGRSGTFDALVNGQSAALVIDANGESRAYHIHLDDFGVYRMAYERPDGSGCEMYEVDLAAGKCDCPASKYRRQDECRHRLALRAALAWLEGGA